MKASIENKIDGLDYATRIKVLDTIAALDKGKGQSVEFNADGSGVCFTVYSETADHGCPCQVCRSFNMEISTLILAGHRLMSHDNPKCL